MASFISFLFFLGLFNTTDAQLTTHNSQVKAETNTNEISVYNKGGDGNVWDDLEDH